MYHTHHPAPSLEYSIIIFLLTFTILFIINKIFAYSRNKEIKENLDKAIKLGYCYIENSDNIPDCPYNFQIIITRNNNINFQDIILGKRNGIDFEIMNYYFKGGKGLSSITRTLWIISNPKFIINSFYLKSNKYRNNYSVPYPTVDFEEDKMFSNKFTLYGQDVKNLKKLFNSDLRTAFIKLTNYYFDFESSRGYFLISTREDYNINLDFNAKLEFLDKMINLYNKILDRYKR